ncbi:deoxynucleoside kinase [Nanoarchaeota archaeon]
MPPKGVSVIESLTLGVGGNIGVGKSTFVQAVMKPPLSTNLLHVFKNDGRFTVKSYTEQFDSNVLDHFYKDSVANALMAQLHFLRKRVERYELSRNHMGIVLDDRIISEDYYIFALAQLELGHMSQVQFNEYEAMFNRIAADIPEPDLFVYFRASVDTLLKRIQIRGRKEELNISPRYLEKLNELYERMIKVLNCPVLTIETDDKELSTFHEEAVVKIIDEITRRGIKSTTPGLSDWLVLNDKEARQRFERVRSLLTELLKKNSKLITVAGNVGLGKSTIANVMQNMLDIKGNFENYDESELYDRFLKDKNKYCYDFQKHLLDIRSVKIKEAKNSRETYVSDRSLPEDVLAFSRQFHKDTVLSYDQLQRLMDIFIARHKEIPQADLLIVLKGSPVLAWKRILQRGRQNEIEGDWSLQKVTDLNNWYLTYAEDVKRLGFHNGATLIVDVDKLNIGSNERHTGYFFERVFKIFSGQKSLFE